MVSILLNCEHPDMELGSELTKLKEFSMSFDPKMRGLTLSNSQTIRSAHNSMARQTLFEFDPKLSAKVQSRKRDLMQMKFIVYQCAWPCCSSI